MMDSRLEVPFQIIHQTLTMHSTLDVLAQMIPHILMTEGIESRDGSDVKIRISADAIRKRIPAREAPRIQIHMRIQVSM